MDVSKVCGLFLIIISIVGVWGSTRNICAGLLTYGYTYPSGDVTIEYGQPLNLTCILYDEIQERDGKDASQDLFFVKNNETIPKEMVEVVNSTSARLYINNPVQASDVNYVCYYKNQSNLVCMNIVSVGVKPQNVTDFTCVSRNYENLTCTWTTPNNGVKTNYTLTFKLKGRGFRAPIRCPNITENGYKRSCVWTISSEPQYRAAQPSFTFTLSMSNQFGSNIQSYQFDHFKHVIPNAPRNLHATATSPHSIQLFWQLPSSMKTFPPGVHHRILYQCEYYPKIWQFGGLIENQNRSENITFELTNLKYAHALCDIRVSMRSAKADKNDESAWSANATRTVRTKSKIPDGPPETNVGSFRIETTGARRNVYVHWKQIREESRNGQNFQYKIQVENPAITNYSSKSFIELRDLPWSEYKIDIWSQNDEGLSLEKSTLIVPARRLPEPQRFIRIAHPDLFELKWDPPRTKMFITNYTIFWCRSENDRYDCDGYLDWITVPNDKVQYNLTLPRNVTHQIAISANGVNSSSGMLWAECTIIPGKNVGKLKNVWISRVGSDFIDVEWKIDCSDHITVAQGFIIHYCQIEKAQTDCIDQMKNITILNKNVFKGHVHNLKPYRTYQLMVAVIISDSRFSQSSDPMYNTTSEAAPSTPPLNLEVVNVTESLISVNWDPPSEINGKLKYYVVYINGTENNVEANKNSFTFTDLESYGTYKIKVSACTVACSNLSEPLIVTTKMSTPGDISKPFILASNNSLITLGWLRPSHPRGKTDYYQLKFAYKISLTNQTDDTLVNITNALNYTMGCDSKKSTYYVAVRAVNIIGNNHKFGPWSDSLQLSNCSAPSQFVYVIVAILFIFVAGAVYFGFKKLYFYFNSMKDVQVKLPPGLQTVVDQQPWGSTKHSEDIDRIAKPDPDEELLLDKLSEARLRVDSGGISTPHETITSSVESVPHLSSDLNKKTSLRQRNKGYNAAETVKPPPQAANYCVLGVDSNKTLNTDSRYLPNLDDETPTCGYVAVDDIVKMPNPGYVPYFPAEPEEKNKGYVMAGMPKDLLVHDLLQCESPNFDENPGYVRASDALSSQKGAQFLSDQPALDPPVTKSGYVSVGDALPPKNVGDVAKGYVPHRQFDATKSIKED